MSSTLKTCRHNPRQRRQNRKALHLKHEKFCPTKRVHPAPKSLAKIKDRITQLTARERTPIPMEDIVGSKNASLRGWANYFHYRNSNGVLEKVKVHAEERLRKHLMKRHKVKDRGIGLGRFPSQQLYTKYGLYKVPTTAGWKTAHALA
ncbi:MAG: group II intron maturase-specific domain-containing protein [Sulfuricella sp.]